MPIGCHAGVKQPGPFLGGIVRILTLPLRIYAFALRARLSRVEVGVVELVALACCGVAALIRSSRELGRWLTGF